MKRPDADGDAASSTPAAAPATGRPAGRHQQSLPPEVMEILAPSLKIGGVAGACGLFLGAAAGIIRSAPPVFFSVITGAQWFTLSTSYYATRLAMMRRLGRDKELTAEDKLKASTLAGGVAGACGGLLRGPRNVLPGALMFSLFGAGGQAFLNYREKRVAARPASEAKTGFWSRWSPVTALSDKDYEKVLEEQLLRVEADIALVDDHIKGLRESEGQTKKEGAVEGEKSSPASSQRKNK